jgi:hypothetical protein
MVQPRWGRLRAVPATPRPRRAGWYARRPRPSAARPSPLCVTARAATMNGAAWGGGLGGHEHKAAHARVTTASRSVGRGCG